MVQPVAAKLKINNNHIYRIVNIDRKNNQVTLAEKENVWNTVDLSVVELIYSTSFEELK